MIEQSLNHDRSVLPAEDHASAVGSGPQEAPGRAARARSGDRAFTLMEIMIVLAIIGLILGVLVLPKLLGSSDKAKKRIAKSQVDGFALSYEEWSADHPGEACPGSLEELVNQPVKGKKGKKLEGKDPWGMPFKMVCGETAPEGVGFGVMSYGGDKKEGGNDDIKSWD